MQSVGRIMQSEGRIMQSFRADSAICETFFLANIQIVESAPQIAESAPDCRIRPSRKKPLRRNIVGALLTLNMELNKKSPPGNGDSKGGFRATQRC